MDGQLVKENSFRNENENYTGYRLKGPGFECRESQEIFLLSEKFGMALGHKKPYIQMLSFEELKRPGCDIDH